MNNRPLCKDLCMCKKCREERQEALGKLYIDFKLCHGWFVMDHGHKTSPLSLNNAKKLLHKIKKCSQS